MPPKRRSSKTNTSENDESESSFHYVTNDQLEKILADNRKQSEKTIKDAVKDAIKNELNDMKQEISRLQSELETVSGVAANALKLSEQLKVDFTKLQEEQVHLKTKLLNSTSEQNKMQEVIEDNKNRQLRKTLVFKGIPEENTANDDNTNPPRENWDETASILAKSMSQALNTTIEEAKQMVERCHRAAPNSNYRGNKPRPIFAAFLDWKDSERTKDAYRKNRALGVIAEQKTGPLTTMRRNIALKERKRLLDQGAIYNGYVMHPARLMVKDSQAPGAKYKTWKDFSNEPVKLR